MNASHPIQLDAERVGRPPCCDVAVIAATGAYTSSRHRVANTTLPQM